MCPRHLARRVTIALALKCKDGIVLATDGKVTRASTSYRTVARIWQKTNKIHPVAPRVLVAGAGELAIIHAVVDALEAAPAEAREQGVDALAPLARDTVVEHRAEAIARYRALYGDALGLENAPRAFFLLVQGAPEPRIVYVSEDGDVEDQTHLGYAATGSGDLILHVRLQAWDPSTLTVEQGALLAYGLVKDTIDSGTFRVSDPVQVWTVRADAPPEEWDEARLDKVAERYHAFRARVHELLRSF
jgi:20S proteasome alpha/beta subunit